MPRVSDELLASRLDTIRLLYGRKLSEIVAVTGLGRTTVQSYVNIVRRELGAQSPAEVAADTRKRIDAFVASVGLANASPSHIAKSLGVSVSQADRALYRLRREARLGNARVEDAKLAADDQMLRSPEATAYAVPRVKRDKADDTFRVVGDELICFNRRPPYVEVGNYVGEAQS